MTDIDDVYNDFDFDASELKAPTEAEIAFAEDVYKIFQDLIDNESGDIGEKSVSRSNFVNCFNKHCLWKNLDKQSGRQNVFYDFKNMSTTCVNYCVLQQNSLYRTSNNFAVDIGFSLC